MAYFYFLFICAVWGSNFLLMKIALGSFGPIGVGAWRVAGGAALLSGVWFARNRELPRLDGHARPMLLVVLFGYVWPFTVQPYLIGLYGSGFIGMMVCLVPLLTILVSVPMLHLWPTKRQMIGVLGGLLCMGVIVYDGSIRQVAWYHLLLALSVPLNYAVCNTYIKKRFTGLSSLSLGLIALAITSAVLIPLAVGMSASGRFPSEAIRIGEDFPKVIAAAVMLGVVGTGLTQLLFLKLVKEQGPLFASMVTYLIPTIAVCWGWLDHEPITRYQVIALAGVLLMVAVVQYKAAAPRDAVIKD